MHLQLNDKVAIITGASRGIGRSIAHILAAEGMRLVLVARSHDQLNNVAELSPVETLVVATDLRDPDAPGAVVAAAMERFGQIDLLVNNAGATKRGAFLALPDTDWMDGFALKFFGAMRLCRAAWPHLLQTQGSIVNIIGIGGRTGSDEFAIGGSVNAALLNLTKSLADRGVRDGIRVNAINPGAILTDRLLNRVRSFALEHGIDEAAAPALMAQSFGVARFGVPEEIAHMVAFLASPLGGFCQGSIIDIDGGQTRTL
ncbi:MAG: SDR family oxidoreductase [Chlorobiaceae bacterium]|nr:SDR family oxidoreductase [Chlorobiaceae bacterium]